MKIPIEVQRLLWEYDLEGVDSWTAVPEAVIDRVMTRGGWVEMRWLIREVGVESLRSYLERRGARVLPPREVAFWSFACSVPEELARDWVRESRAREEEWRG